MNKDMQHGLTALDLFCGGGGFTEGLKNAGFNVIAGIDNDKYVWDTYKTNHPDTILIKGKVEDPASMQKLSNYKNGGIDLIVASPPCQPFSLLANAENRVNDPRKQLIASVVKWVDAFNPKMFVIENVPGMLNSVEGIDAFLAFQNLGYRVIANVHDAKDYGIPQKRKRALMVGVLGNHHYLSFQHPFRIEERKDSNYFVVDALRLVEGYKPIGLKKFKNMNKNEPEAYEFAKRLWHVHPDNGELNLQRLGYLKEGECHKDLPKELQCKAPNKFKYTHGRLRWYEHAPTLTCGAINFGSGRYAHPEEDRMCTIREYALLQSFPLSYYFDTDYIKKAMRIIGNAVPPLFAKLIGLECSKILLPQKS